MIVKREFSNSFIDYKLYYCEERNVLIESIRNTNTNIETTVETEGSMFGKTKFTKDTVDQYILKSIGGFLPLFDQEKGLIYQNLPELNDLTNYPLLHYSSGISNGDGEIEEFTETINQVNQCWYDVNDIKRVNVYDYINDPHHIEVLSTPNER